MLGGFVGTAVLATRFVRQFRERLLIALEARVCVDLEKHTKAAIWIRAESLLSRTLIILLDSCWLIIFIVFCYLAGITTESRVTS